MSEKRSLWGSKVGFLLAAIGSAVGLGNIWRFSYMAYENGGGAFLIPYLTALLCTGLPLMILEYALGHREKASPPLAFARIHHLWEPLGWWMPVVAFSGITFFYTVIISWCMNYFCLSFNLGWGADTQAFFFNRFLRVSDSPFVLGGIRWPILAGTVLTWLICWSICYRDVRHGIEKASTIFMPLLVVLTLILVGWSLRLDGALDAVKEYYLKADLSKISLFTAAGRKVWVAAFGQIFFTLSLGFGIMITYASYLPKKTDITGNALVTCFLNCLYSVIAGFAVFGTIGFMAKAKGVPFEEAITGGPGLAFVVYPEAINQLPLLNHIFGVLFFLVLIVAGISSMISLIEAFSCSVCDKFSISRKKASSVICGIGLFGSILFTTRAGLLILDIVDHFINNYALILGGIVECVVVGWLLKSQVMRRHVNKSGGLRLLPLWDISVRFITPGILFIIVSGALLGDFSAAYGNYPVNALLLYGGGVLFFTWLTAFVLSHFPWKSEKLKVKHDPDKSLF
ncbi:MAG: neurotransmitter:Na+ symporter, family [Verrucomicrobiota bacterium]|jgi:NSS family neurotransmitter:Na+ symporter|nr:neurotransmitter:Na+ symporter, family [Verrucomicrobiota bacterium]MDK2962803.1 neurotransmitter:Na+ symporter, family [Verrucomicrobiota bacterium]